MLPMKNTKMTYEYLKKEIYTGEAESNYTFGRDKNMGHSLCNKESGELRTWLKKQVDKREIIDRKKEIERVRKIQEEKDRKEAEEKRLEEEEVERLRQEKLATEVVKTERAR